MTKLPTPEAKQPLSNTADQDTATQAGIEKTLFDEIAKGLKYAAKSVGAIDEQEQLTLLSEAENAYQNAVYLIEQTGTVPEQPLAQKLHQLGVFLERNDALQEGN
jgi:hypothetical protein